MHMCGKRQRLQESEGYVFEGRRWHLEEELGEGTYARVHRTRCPSTGEVCAAKVVHTPSLSVWSSNQLQSEVRIWSQLTHPNVCKLHGAVINGESHVLVMELAKGGELFNYLVQKTLNETQAADVIRQVLSAVEYLHTQGILHRDIKPENILVSDRDARGNLTVKIADFGASKILLGPNKQAITPCGSMGYAAPEMMRGSESYGSACDMWSVGVLAYILLSSTMPYDPAQYSKARFTQPCFPDDSWGHISHDAREFVKSLLKLSPHERPSASQALRHDWLNSTPPPTPLLTPTTAVATKLRDAFVQVRAPETQPPPLKAKAVDDAGAACLVGGSCSGQQSSGAGIGVASAVCSGAADVKVAPVVVQVEVVQPEEPEVVPTLHLPYSLLKRLEERRSAAAATVAMTNRTPNAVQ